MKKKTIIPIVLFLIIILFILYKYSSSTDRFSSDINYYNYVEKLYTKFEYKFQKIENYTDLGVVDAVYCIVMPQRKEYMKQKFESMGINYIFFNAITPKELSTSDFNKLSSTNDPKSKLYTHPTRLGLQVSFTMCFIDAINKNYNTIIVFEDDIVVNIDTPSLKKSIIEFKSTNFIFFYMGYCWMNCKQNFTIKPLMDIPDKTLFCTHAICYKVKYLKQFINDMYPMNDNFDNNIVYFIKKYNYPVCITPKTYFDQNRLELGTLNDDETVGNLPDCNVTFNS
uniref:Glycosyl transferase family 25 domain-containing protein n=1 Tax=viral metagenome TaxID=1070528 RepID=A0A6C0AZX0_9ZZZZ